jgi:4-hydroxybenzoate polyprenyltransferase
VANTRVSAADVLFGIAAPPERSFRNKIVGFITLQRIGINIGVLPLVLGMAALAGARFNDLGLLPLLIVTFLACGVAVMTNDIIDIERDKRKWPLKPLATGLISRSEAALYTAILAGLALAIAGLVFNGLFVTLVLLVLVLNYLYSRYMRDNIGYLITILPLAFIPVAFSHFWGSWCDGGTNHARSA